MPVVAHLQRRRVNCRSHFVLEYKRKRVIKRKAFRNRGTDIPFKVQFPLATLFAIYHCTEHVASWQLNRVPAESLNQVFNEPCHSCAAVTAAAAAAELFGT